MQPATTTRIARTERGSGTPSALFLPGWCGDRTVFDTLVEEMGKHRRALSLDWRGHGESYRPGADFGQAELVEDALDVIASESGPVVPVALAHAGWVAVELRRRLGPDRVPALVFLDWMVLGAPPPFLDALAGLQREDSWEAVRSGLFDMWTTGLEIPELSSYVDSMGDYGFDMWSRAGREIGRAFEEQGSPLAAVERLDPTPPTLHLYAQPDEPRLLEAQRDYARDHPWFGVHRLPARSHFPMFEVPEEITDRIEGFLGAATASR
jgi:pimeloyl-ACP methyl ester carboxylesterase